jgi:hypothetical protein
MMSFTRTIRLVLSLILIAPGVAFSQTATQTCIPTSVLDKLIGEAQEKDRLTDLYQAETTKTTDLTRLATQQDAMLHTQSLSITELNNQVSAQTDKATALTIRAGNLTADNQALTRNQHLLGGVCGALLLTTVTLLLLK